MITYEKENMEKKSNHAVYVKNWITTTEKHILGLSCIGSSWIKYLFETYH